MLRSCKDCRRPVRWVLTKKGRRMALDPEPSGRGRVLLVEPGIEEDLHATYAGRAVTLSEGAALTELGQGRDLYVPHVATCTGQRA